MKKVAVYLSGIVLLAAPAFAFAQSAIPIGPSASQLLTAVATIEAQESALQRDQSLACAALFSAPSVPVGQTVILAWGSAGAVSQTHDVANEWALNGASTVSFAKAGTWTYSFTFYDAAGNSATCEAKVAAVAAQ